MLNPDPDWYTLVRKRLHLLDLPAKQQREVIAELAAHLQDVYEKQLQNGRTESEARERALNEVAQSPQLARQIQRAKREEKMMNNRTRTLWVPGLVSLTAAMACLAISTLVGLQPRFEARGLATGVVYLPWLLALPLCGAAGAYLSRRAGGERPARLAAGLFPVIALAMLIGFLVLIGKFVLAKPEWLYFSVAALLGAILPSMALWLGAMPFLKPSGLRES
jgi:cation transport ATPase